jgi:hypothetical protein
LTIEDPFPHEIEFEIDRERLLRYMLIQARIGCFVLTFPISLLLAVAFFNARMAPYPNAGIWFQFGWFSIYMMGCFLVCGVFCQILYLAYFRPSARLKAKNLQLMVEGPYLRLVSGGYMLVDQRFHFREICSYTTVQGPLLRRHGMKSLRIRLNGHSTTPPLTVTGLIDVDRVRNVICEIDASRESLSSLGPHFSGNDTSG